LYYLSTFFGRFYPIIRPNCRLSFHRYVTAVVKATLDAGSILHMI